MAAIIGYLFGAVPVGVLVCRIFGVNILQEGSGRTGTTNVWRAAGLKAAIPTLLGDALKGAIAVLLVRNLVPLIFPDPSVMSPDVAFIRVTIWRLAEALAGGMAIMGHNWSIFLGFRGGAGGVTSAVTTMALMPMAGGIVWLVGAGLYWWTRIASVATFSVSLSAFVVFLMLSVNERAPWPYVIYGVIALISVFIALRDNREKLKEGNERVITLW
ncbi:glycerol-3-phosphate acyltransferase [Chloroflexi bacterium TSY]|nr:glycerol-3-phosphate acyltransferase [Chloroflexi bacterium TSY]